MLKCKYTLRRNEIRRKVSMSKTMEYKTEVIGCVLGFCSTTIKPVEIESLNTDDTYNDYKKCCLSCEKHILTNHHICLAAIQKNGGQGGRIIPKKNISTRPDWCPKIDNTKSK